MGPWSLKSIPAGDRQSGGLVNSSLDFVNNAKGECDEEQLTEVRP